MKKGYIEQIDWESKLAVIIMSNTKEVVSLELLPPSLKETDNIIFDNGKYLLDPENEKIKKKLKFEIEELLKQVVKPMPTKNNQK